MKRRATLGQTLLLCFSLPLLILLQPGAEAITAFRLRRNFTLIESSKGLTPEASIRIPRRLPSPWQGKLVAIRARPQRTSPVVTETIVTTTQVVYETETTPPDNGTSLAKEDDTFKKRSDDGSENPLSVVWPLRSRASKRFRIHQATTPAPQVLLKLLQPKPTRPAIYSLDGFVPKPSIRRPVSTEAPRHFQKTDLQGLSSIPRRRKVNRYSKEDVDDDDDEEYSYRSRKKKKISRYTAFARKGVPGEDYPVFTYIPRTDFECGLQPGLYADPNTDCQVWHMCPGGNLSPRHSFLCPNGTIFNQKKRICDWWYNVDCRKHSRKLRSLDSA